MKSNLVFKIYRDTISISEIKKELDYKSLNNTNVIDLKELKFSIEYIRENFELVSNFLSVIIIKKNVKCAKINSIDTYNVALDLIKEWPQIEKILFSENKTITYNVFIKLLDIKSLKQIDCYEMPSYLIERIDTNQNIKVTQRHKYETNTKFMIINSLNNFSDIYYKKQIVLSGDFEESDLDDLTNFFNLNAKLKKITIVNYSNELLTYIIDKIEKSKKKNIVITINEKNNNLNTIYTSVNHIKKHYKKYFEENNIKFKLSYSDEYKKENFLKEINFKMITTMILLIVGISGLVVGINCYQQYLDRNKISEQEKEFENILQEAEKIETIDDNDNDVDYIDVGNNELEPTTKKVYSGGTSAYYTNFEQVFDTLLQKNPDTVGWLTVNNTRVNYPVTQSTTNSYYLNHDFNKKKNSMGWIFMDYRNELEAQSKNTIIYGHNIKQGILFGTIKKMFNSSWYKKPSNLIITFNTPTKNMKWKIFSMYQINTTEDYLVTDFKTDQEYIDFINMIKGRSIVDFETDVPTDSKILTLSTCFSHTTRHVVHAVLISEESTVKQEETTTQEAEVTTTQNVENNNQ